MPIPLLLNHMLGETISHYRILEKLGEGGMGVVYRAEDTKLKRAVALKFLPPELTRDAEAKARFLHEAQAAAVLSHPNICTIYEIDEADGRSFIAMELVEGTSLKDRIARGPLSSAKALDIAVQIARGLDAAHHRGVVHRDMKPANIMITGEGVAKILDFGLAKLEGQMRLTKDSSTLGTVAYMSPEQAGGKELDRRTDIWSLGVILYEMLTGRLPFKGEYEQAMLYAILNEPATPLASVPAELSRALQPILDKALAKKPDDRYRHAADMLGDLESIAAPLGATSLRAPARRRALPAKVLFIGVAACAVIVAAVVVGRVHRSGPREKPISSIAVLPFQNLSAEPGQEYFSDGVTEALIAELSKIRALRVISRTSVMRFKKSEMSLPEIARQLKVDAVVEGSVQRAESEVRVTAQLVQAAPEKHLWANTYTQSYRNILALESDIAQEIALEIRVAVTADEKERLMASRPVDPAAHEAYLKGLYHFNKFNETDIQKAKKYFEEAIALDSSYALPYVGLAEIYDFYAIIYPEETLRKLAFFARKALSIDPTNAEAHALLADVDMFSWNWGGAEANFRRALALNPNDPTAHAYYGNFLQLIGKSGKAIEEARRACEIDPLSPGPRTVLASIYIQLRQYDRADSLVTEIEGLDSTLAITYGMRGTILMGRGDFEAAVPLLREAAVRGDSTTISALAISLARSGRKAEARSMLELGIRMWNEGYPIGTGVAAIYLGLGQYDSTFVWFEKAFERREPTLPWIRIGWFFGPVRKDPRYVAMMKKVGLEP